MLIEPVTWPVASGQIYKVCLNTDSFSVPEQKLLEPVLHDKNTVLKAPYCTEASC